jgi:hypothetical protein
MMMMMMMIIIINIPCIGFAIGRSDCKFNLVRGYHDERLVCFALLSTDKTQVIVSKYTATD